MSLFSPTKLLGQINELFGSIGRACAPMAKSAMRVRIFDGCMLSEFDLVNQVARES